MELFKEAEAVGFAGVPSNKVSDWMKAEDEMFMHPLSLIEYKRAEKAGLSILEVDHAHPSQHYLYMLKVLALEVG